MTTPFKMSPIGSDDKRGWKVLVDGQEVKAGIVEIVSPTHGKLTYGMRPEGFDSWVFAQAGGGGAVTILYTHINGVLHLGLLLENRSNLSEKPTLCIVGGFIDPGQTAKQAQATEAEEEAGLDSTKARELMGPPVVCNRLFWHTDVDQGQGDHTYAFELSSADLVESEENQGVSLLQSQRAIVPKNQAKVRFYPWYEAIQKTPDALALSAIAKLLAEEHFEKVGRGLGVAV